MSVAARKRIAKAQRLRWRLQKQAERERKGEGGGRGSRNKEPKLREEARRRMIKRWADPAFRKKNIYALKKAAAQKSRAARSAQAKKYWANMTPEQRSAEALRRQQVTAAKKREQRDE